MNVKFDEKLLEQLRSYIWQEVAAGFVPENEIVESAVEGLRDDCDEDVLRRHAERIAAELMLKHKREQASWPAATDCDRLDRSFAVLENAGIVCRQNFSCCGSCGAAEIFDEMELVGESGKQARGYAFFHMQDTESAVEGGGLYLNYGADLEGEEAAVAIGREIAAVLDQHGLKVEWDGTLSRRIGVSMNWQRRR